MITVTKIFADRLERSVNDLTAEIHGDLSWHDDLGTTLVSAEFRYSYMIVFCNNGNNIIRSDNFLLIWGDDILECLLGKFKGYFLFLQFGTCHYLIKGTFQLTDIGFDVCCNVINDFFADIVAFELFFFVENCHSGLVIR